MNLEDGLALVDIGQVHMYLSVEASGTQQGLVQDVGAVGGSQDDDAAVGAEAVHLGQQLVQGALALVVAPHHRVAGTGAAHGINLVDEDDAGTGLLGLTEEVAHTTGPHADEHLHEVASRHGEEGDVGLAGNGLGQEGLTRSRRSHQQGSLGYLAAQVSELLGILQELHNLLHLLLGTGLSGHVSKGDLGVFVHLDLLRTAAAHVEDVHATSHVSAASHAAHNEHPEEDEEQERTEVYQNVPQGAVLLLIGEFTREVALLLLLVEEILQFVDGTELHDDVGLHIVLATGARLEDVADMLGLDIHVQRSLFLVDDDARGIAALDVLFELAVRGRLRRTTLRPVTAVQEEPAQRYRNDEVEPTQVEAGLPLVIFGGNLIIVLSHVLYYELHIMHYELVQILNFRQFRIGPEVLQIVEVAHIGQEDVDDDIHIVHSHPHRLTQSVHGNGLLPGLLAHRLADAVGQSLHLRGGVARADNESLADGVLNVLKVYDHDVVSLFLLYSFYYLVY